MFGYDNGMLHVQPQNDTWHLLNKLSANQSRSWVFILCLSLKEKQWFVLGLLYFSESLDCGKCEYIYIYILFCALPIITAYCLLSFSRRRSSSSHSSYSSRSSSRRSSRSSSRSRRSRRSRGGRDRDSRYSRSRSRSRRRSESRSRHRSGGGSSRRRYDSTRSRSTDRDKGRDRNRERDRDRDRGRRYTARRRTRYDSYK